MRRSRLVLALGGILGAGVLVVSAVQTFRAERARGGPQRVDGSPVLHCQSAVEGILRTRTIRFEEASAALDPASNALLGEVADALRPCAGSRIAITGHTDAQGEEAANVALSLARARTVREGLVARGISRADLRARGVGSAQPVAGLEASDPANRRIEFSVLTPARIKPTPIDTPVPN